MTRTPLRAVVASHRAMAWLHTKAT